MQKKIFNQKILRASSKKLAEIEEVVKNSSSSLKKLLFYNNLIFWAFFLAFISLLLAGITYSSLPSRIPLFYSLPWGENQLASKIYIFLLPSLTISFSLINIVSGKIIPPKEKSFLATMLAFFSFFTSLISLIAAVKIIFLVI